MPASTALLDALATQADSLITHLALFDDTGTEISGGSPAYARQAVTWTSPSDGLIRPTADLTFDIPSGATVAEWRAFSAATGGTDYGSGDLTDEEFASQGQYTLVASLVGIDLDAG